MHTFIPLEHSIPNIVDVHEELREKAFKRTAEMLRKLDEIRRSLELPAEQLPIVIKMYNTMVTALIAEAEREESAKHVKRMPITSAKHVKRMPITMRSENRDYEPMKIPRGGVVPVIVRPQFLAFRPEDFAIHGDRSRWMVHDIKVGNRSQFMGSHGPAAGTEFGPGGICENLKLETVQTAMDLTLDVEYVGPEPGGEVFEATIIGTAAI